MGFRWSLMILIVFSLSHLAHCASMDFQCLKCICETATQCVSRICQIEKCAKIEINNHECSCGPYGISPPYWMSANKPTIDGKDGTDAEKFKKCVETFPCSIWTVQYYMDRNAQDCDNDKLINCNDYVLIHTFGPTNCFNASLNEEQLKRYKTCMSRTEIIYSGGSGKITSTTTVQTTSEDSSKTDVASSRSSRERSNSTNQNFELSDEYDVFT